MHVSRPRVEDVMCIHGRVLRGALLFGCVALTSRVATAQVQVHIPIHGVTGIVALPYNVDRFYTDLDKLLTALGGHLGGASTQHVVEPASLESLKPGMPVVVHYTVRGIQASPYDANQGTVADIHKKVVTIRFADGATRSLRYTTHTPTIDDGEVRRGTRA